MAAENHRVNPIIVEPIASPDSGTPHQLLNPSLNSSSSSNFLESSRPQSRGSSTTSPSESSSPIPRSTYSHELSNIAPPTPPNLELPTPSTTPTTASVPSAPTESSSHSNGAAWLLFSRRRWLEHALGIFTLVASLFGLLFIDVRTYKLAVISTQNSALEGCTNLIQAGFRTVENSTPLCKTIMENGPLSSPYHLGKRRLHETLVLASRWMKGPSKQHCGFPYIGCQSQVANTTYRNISGLVIIISTTIALRGIFLIVARRNSRSTEVFTSPARSDIQITHQNDSGPKTETGQGIIERQNAEDHHDLSQLRKRIQASQNQDGLMKDTATFQSTNSSSTTLVDELSKPQVELKNRSSGEKHEGLIELQMNGNTKAFFNIKTSEVFRLKHWNRKHSHDSGSSSDNENPPSIEEKDFIRTGPGASALARGKAVKHKCIEEVQLEHEKWHNRHQHATQQAGEYLTGLVNNETPSGKSQTS